MNYCVGIDLGGTNIVAGVVNKDGTILEKASCKTNLPREAADIAADMAKVTREAVKNAGLTMEDISWVGVGCPGTVNQDTGVIEYANNLQFYDVPLRDMLKNDLGKDVFMDNDANAAAYGEFVAGAAKGSNTAVAITLGTGVGGGIIIDGKIYSGMNFAGAELGHNVLVMDGRPCTCGRNGCLEAYASATALINLTREAMEENKQSKMWEMCENDLGKVSGRTAFEAMRAGDQTGKDVVALYTKYLATGVTNIINTFQPDVLCIGGGISKEGETLLAPLREIVSKEVYSRFSKKQTKIVEATLGNDAGVIGAAMLGAMER